MWIKFPVSHQLHDLGEYGAAAVPFDTSPAELGYSIGIRGGQQA